MKLKEVTILQFIENICSETPDEELINEYYTNKEDINSKKALFKLNNLGFEGKVLLLLTSCYNILIQDNNKEILIILKSNGYTIQDNSEKELNKLKTHIKNAEMSYARAFNEWDNYKKTETKQIKESDFMDYVAGISHALNLSININVMTMFEFLSYEKLATNGRR